MSYKVALMYHVHIPIFRVIPADTKDPLDVSYSQIKKDNRWNTPEFPALYACCSKKVVEAIIQDRYRKGAIILEDLDPSRRPHVVKLSWSGKLVDVATKNGIIQAGFNENYPEGVDYTQTQLLATKCHEAEMEGVVCRSASLSRFGFKKWEGDHQSWGEIAVFVRKAKNKPQLLK